MEEDDDDFYSGAGHKQEEEAQQLPVKSEDDDDDKAEKMDMSEDEGEEEEDSDDDFQITLEKPQGAKPTPPTGAGAKHLLRQQPTRTASSETPKPASTAQASSAHLKPEPRATSTAPPQAVKGTLLHNGKEGSSFPEARTSNIDVNGNPNLPGTNKSILELDIDADLAEHSKPWRLPGTDQTDFFNYGFDEYTWTQYCVRQQSMGNAISQQKDADAQMKAFFGGGGGPGGPGGMSGGGGMGGMPDPTQMMEMVNQGVIPPEFAQMMQMGGMPGMPGMGGPGGPGGFGSQGGGGGFGSDPNSVSPQPPSGPSGGQGFPPPGMEGYSSQQMAIMQQDHSGGGGGRGRGRRGRGYY